MRLFGFIFPGMLGCAVILFTLLSVSNSFAQEFKITGLVQNSQPKYILSKNRSSGLCVDIYRHLKSRLKSQNNVLTIDDKYTPIKRILREVEISVSKVFCGAGRNESRESRFIYSPLPLYTVSKIVMTHREDKWNPGSFGEIAESKSPIGSLFGTSSLKFLSSQPGLNIYDRIHDLETALNMIAKKRIRYFYYHDLALLYLIRKSPLPLRAVPSKLRSTPHWMIYNNNLPHTVRHVLDQEITKMVHDGAVEKIWQRYKPKS